jgi:hypothetical protein
MEESLRFASALPIRHESWSCVPVPLMKREMAPQCFGTDDRSQRRIFGMRSHLLKKNNGTFEPEIGIYLQQDARF